jgi:hypothetical protein
MLTFKKLFKYHISYIVIYLFYSISCGRQILKYISTCESDGTDHHGGKSGEIVFAVSYSVFWMDEWIGLASIYPSFSFRFWFSFVYGAEDQAEHKPGKHSTAESHP